MKPQTPEEILDRYVFIIPSTDGRYVARVLLENVTDAMKEHTRQAIKYALEDAENNGEVDDYSGAKAFIKKSSILSRYETILKELGL